MKQKHIILLSILVIDIVIFSLYIFFSSPLNYVQGGLLLITAIILLFLGSDYVRKINYMKITTMMLSSKEFRFQSEGKSKFTDYLVQERDLYGNEKIIENFYKNFFTYRLLVTPEKEILCFLNKILTSDLYNNCLQVRTALNQAIVTIGFEKYAHPCALAIFETNQDGYKYMSVVELIEQAFSSTDNNELLTKLRNGINYQVDICTYLLSEEEKEIINKFKLPSYEEKSENNVTEKFPVLIAAD